VDIVRDLLELEDLKLDGLRRNNTTETQPTRQKTTKTTTKRIHCCPNAQTVTGQFELTKFHSCHKKSD
jgi:hypothetical protein